MYISLFFSNFALVMAFQIQIDILNFISKGMLIGIIASAPMGPVGVLCVQRTLNKGRWYGFVTGIGAAVSDMIYAAIAGFGMSFVMDFLGNQETRMYLQIVGSLLLFAFGLFTWRSDPTKKIHQSGNGKGTLAQRADGFSRHILQSADYLPLPGMLCAVCLCHAQSSF